MVTIDQLRKIALSFKDAVELPHFEITSFRVNKKIFATLDEKNKRVCITLSKVNQSVFSDFDPESIYPVPNKWGQKGATYFELKGVRKDMLKDALSLSYDSVAPKKSSKK